MGFAQKSEAQGCKELTLGVAISLTGKYATNGIHAQNGYVFATMKISQAGGVIISCYIQ